MISTDESDLADARRFKDKLAKSPCFRVRNLAAGPMKRRCAVMIDDQLALITSIVRRTPEWVRHDLLAKDPGGRQRAEEALSAMIAAALRPDDKVNKQIGWRWRRRPRPGHSGASSLPNFGFSFMFVAAPFSRLLVSVSNCLIVERISTGRPAG